MQSSECSTEAVLHVQSVGKALMAECKAQCACVRVDDCGDVWVEVVSKYGCGWL